MSLRINSEYSRTQYYPIGLCILRSGDFCAVRNEDSVLGTVTTALGWKFEESWCEFRKGQKCISFPERPCRPSDPHSFLFNRDCGCSSGAKRLGREADHSPHLLPKLRTIGAISPFPHVPSWCV